MMTDPATAGVTSDAWATVMYHSLYRLGLSADFADGRTAIVDTATEYGFTEAQLNAINDAFDDAGIAAACHGRLNPRDRRQGWRQSRRHRRVVNFAWTTSYPARERRRQADRARHQAHDPRARLPPAAEAAVCQTG